MKAEEVPKFTESFGEYVVPGDFITVHVNGLEFFATVVHDEDANIDDDDSHNIDQAVTGCDDDQQKKLIAAREAWKNDEWFYCGIVISVNHGDDEILANAASFWHIDVNYPESDNSYLKTVANELIEEAIEATRKHIAEKAELYGSLKSF